MTKETERANKVCVVDDDASIRRSVKRLLIAAKYPVETFASASEFLSSGAAITCSCAILDVLMPGMDGLGLQEALSSAGMQFPVIFLTACNNTRMEEMARKNGAVAYFHKPISGEELLDAVCAALGG